jgi:AcrR family transcriptional regulator
MARPAVVPDRVGGPTGQTETSVVKPLRADARRNREKLLAAAADAFAENGVDVSLEEVARSAGVGIGTLYRNFPTREELVLGVYHALIDDLDDASRTLLEQHTPADALHEWMRAFVRYTTVKRGLIGLLRTLMQTTDSTLFERTRATLRDAADRLLDAARASGEIRSDIGAPELIRAMGGVCMATDVPASDATSMALVDLIFDGLRYRG